jgi:hypothetical protein
MAIVMHITCWVSALIFLVIFLKAFSAKGLNIFEIEKITQSLSNQERFVIKEKTTKGWRYIRVEVWCSNQYQYSKHLKYSTRFRTSQEAVDSINKFNKRLGIWSKSEGR